MQNIKLLEINLRLFDGAAGAAAGAGGEAGGDAGAAAPEQTVQANESTLPKAERRTGSSRRKNAGELSNVIYGKQESAQPETVNEQSPDAEGTKDAGKSEKSGVMTTSDSLEAKKAEFEKLIDGEYKDIYTEKFQQAFNRRFKEVKGMEQSLNAQKPILDMLMQKYKIGDGDISKLQSAIEADDTYWEDAADEAGLTVEQYKAMQKLERENAELKRIRQRQLGEQQAQQQLNEWYKQAEQVKELYPSFDFKIESANKDFLGLLRSGLPVQKAYELMHMEEIKEAAARSAAQTAGEQVVAKLKTKAARPSENGTSSQSAVTIKSDVSTLTRADRAEIARRASRGEKIRF